MKLTCVCDGKGWIRPHVWFVSPQTSEWRLMIHVPQHMRSIVTEHEDGLRKLCLVCGGSGLSPRHIEELNA